jgi:superfamily II DNA/RNA helicase
MNLSKLRIVVLDEADEMLDLGFLPDVEAILRATPDSRQSMLFSATMPKEVIGLARRYMRQPTFVHAESDQELLVPLTKQYFFQVHPLNRFQVLTRLLDIPGRERAAIFRRTKRGVDRTIAGLRELGYKAGALHGDMQQQVRERVMTQFRKGKIDVLVCTDVAARGLDIAGLSHVVNYDTPEDDKAYVHRIGRTGRAGAAGVAITFVAWNELETADLIRKRLELEEEPIREIYSTSPELTELFGMPSVEDAATARGVAPARKAEPRPVPTAAEVVETTDKPRTTTRRRRRRASGTTAVSGNSTTQAAATG